MSSSDEEMSENVVAPEGGRRRVLLINPKFQLTFLAYMLIIAATVILVLFASNLYFFKRCYDGAVAMGLSADHEYFGFIDSQKTTMMWIFLAAAGVTFVNLLFWGMYLSHRVAGPIYRLTRYVEDIADGKIKGELSFRKKDYFPELADAINRFVKKLGIGSHSTRKKE